MMQSIGAPSYIPSQAAPSASAVNIQIFEPKAYAAPQTQAAQPQQFYNYPQQSMYAPQPFVNQYQQFVPQAPQYTPIPQYAPMPQYSQPQEMQLPQQQMPAPVIAPVAEQAQNQTPSIEPQTAPQTQEVNVAQAEATQPDQNQVDINSIISGLQSNDYKTQEDAITKIANYSQGSPELQSAVLSEPVMMGLAKIAGQDTSSLQGPTDAQIAAINKAASGAQLTPEEEALTKELAPKTAADKNKVISMFTLAMLQKGQREEIDRYNSTQDAQNQLPQLKINDLIGYQEIEKAARSNSEGDKEVKLAAIQALSYAARPEDKDTIAPVLTTALKDTEPLIQQAATEALTNLGVAADAPSSAQDEKQGEIIDFSKMSKKEKKAYEKAQKKAAKEAGKAA